MAIKKEIELEVNVESVGNLKQQLKQAQREVEALSEKFGATSEQATNAAQKAAQLKDAIGDAKALTDAFNPDAKFNALGGALQGVAGGFSAVQGAMGLVGVESKDVEATLLKVQSAMALSEGINSVMAAKDAFTNLAAVIGRTAIGQKLLTAAQIAGAAAMRVLNVVMAANPILLIVSGVTALVGAFYLLTRSTDKQAEAEKELNRQKELSIKLTKIQQEDAENYVKSLQKNSANKIALRKAEGANDEEIYQLEKSRLEEQIRYTKLLHDSGVKLTAEQYANQKQAKIDLKILEAQHETDLKEIRDKSEEERRTKAEENRKKRLEEKRIINEFETNAEQAFLDEAAQRELTRVEEQKNKDLSTAELKKKINADYLASIKAQNDKAREEDRIAEEEDLKRRQTLNKQKLEMAQNALGVLTDAMSLFTAKNEKDARRQFKINKALSLSSAFVNTALAVTAALTAGGNPIKLATGMQFVEAGIAAASGAVAIAKIAQTQFGGSGGASVSSGGSNPSNAMGGSNVITPTFNIVGNNGQNQLGNLAPVQAYVVSGEMTTQQALDRNRLRNATF